MHFPAVVLTSKARALLAVLLFLVAWFFGNGALILGLEMEEGVFAACVFAFACGLWWTSYKISRSAHGKGMTLGLVALGIWMLNLIGALVFAFRHSVANPFFWVATAIFSFLITAFAVSDVRPNLSKSASSPD